EATGTVARERRPRHTPEAHSESMSTGYIRSLDGLRAVAALAVIVFHGAWWKGGWIGVPVFFVLSGFLIGRILLRTKDEASGARGFFVPFYRRRALRLLPLYVFFLIVLAVVNGLTGAISGFSEVWPYLATYTYNWVSGMPDMPTHESYGILWSLAIEEQFYLVWPLLVWALPRRWMPGLCVALVALGPVIRWGTGLIALEAYGPKAHLQWSSLTVYQATTSHLDAFAWGTLAALWAERRPAYTGLWALGTSGAAVVAGVVFALGTGGASLAEPGVLLRNLWHWSIRAVEGGGHVWSYTLINAASAAVVLHLSQRGSRLLESRPLVWVGRVSYGVYVYHILVKGGVVWAWSGLGFSPEAWTASGAAFLAVWIAATLLVSWASFRWIETPFLRLKGKREEAPILAPVGSKAA
ncbi:MAG: acyltransferase, partial [Bacteroidota bacterium]